MFRAVVWPFEAFYHLPGPSRLGAWDMHALQLGDEVLLLFNLNYHPVAGAARRPAYRLGSEPAPVQGAAAGVRAPRSRGGRGGGGGISNTTRSTSEGRGGGAWVIGVHPTTPTP
jgi:hypothetical protein